MDVLLAHEIISQLITTTMRMQLCKRTRREAVVDFVMMLLLERHESNTKYKGDMVYDFSTREVIEYCKTHSSIGFIGISNAGLVLYDPCLNRRSQPPPSNIMISGIYNLTCTKLYETPSKADQSGAIRNRILEKESHINLYPIPSNLDKIAGISKHGHVLNFDVQSPLYSGNWRDKNNTKVIHYDVVSTFNMFRTSKISTFAREFPELESQLDKVIISRIKLDYKFISDEVFDLCWAKHLYPSTLGILQDIIARMNTDILGAAPYNWREPLSSTITWLDNLIK